MVMLVYRRQQGLVEEFTLEAQRSEGSLEFNIENLVLISFIIKPSLSPCSIDIIISTKRYKEVYSAVNIIVTDKVRIYEQWFCTDGLSEKRLMRDLYYDFGCGCGPLKWTFDVIVSEMLMMGPSLYEDENYTDFRLSTVDGSVCVHKASLATHSEMFKAMLNGEWKETVEGRIEVEGASLQTLQALKDFMYLGKLPEEGLETLLQIAIRFFIESLKRQCILKLALKAKPEDYLKLLDFARDKEIVELTFALVQLTPKTVINSAYQMMITSKQIPEAGH